MAASDEYKRKAADCLTRASVTSDLKDRAELLALSAKWMRLAQLADYPNVAGLPDTFAPPGASENSNSPASR